MKKRHWCNHCGMDFQNLAEKAKHKKQFPNGSCANMKGGETKMRDFPKSNIPEVDPKELEIEEQIEMLQKEKELKDKKKELAELKRADDELVMPTPPEREDANVRVIEREVNLQLLNDKLNYILQLLNDKLNYIIGLLHGGKE